jgi:CDP-diacylglycerol--serine O-phosphatidyltransferase
MLGWDRGVGLLSACRWKYQIDSDIRPFDAGIWHKTCIKRLKSKLWSHRAWWCASGARAFTSCPICSPWPRCFGGFYAIVMAMNGRFDYAAVGVFCAMVLDSLDGRVARMTNTQSAFGEQMDSLSDMVSFGAAPALISYEWALQGVWGAGAGSRPLSTAPARRLRLARFNVNTGSRRQALLSRGCRLRPLRPCWPVSSWLMTDAGHQGARPWPGRCSGWPCMPA